MASAGKKTQRGLIRLMHKETGYYYTTTVRKSNMDGMKLKLKKYNPVTRQQEEFVETKV